jgi:hypothetical protein
LLIALAGAINFSYAQWAITGNNISTTNSGTANASTKLKLIVSGWGPVQNITNDADQDIQFLLTAPGVSDKMV